MADETKPIENHCPFGCPNSNLDELGYCEHLVGFSNPVTDRDQVRVLEPLVLRRRYNRESKEWVEDGNVMVDGREPEAVQLGDKLVNPEFQQKDDHGNEHTATRWVSARVYSDDPDRKPVPVEQVKKQVVRRQMAKPVVRNRVGMKAAAVDEEDKATAEAAPKPKSKSRAIANSQTRKRGPDGRIVKSDPPEQPAEAAEETLLP